MRKTTRKLLNIMLALTLLCWPFSMVAAGLDEPAAAKMTCQWLSLPKTCQATTTRLAVGHDGTPWIMSRSKLLFWDGKQFREPVAGPPSTVAWVEHFFGAADRGLYAVQRIKKHNQSVLYRLDDAAATEVTTVYQENPHCGIYISRSGTLFNWGTRFLARFDGNDWDRIEARLALEKVKIFDTGKTVYFYYDNELYGADSSGRLKQYKCPRWTPSRPGQNHIIGKLWAGHKALLLNYGHPGLFAFDLATGKEIDLSKINTLNKDVHFYDAFSRDNGEVWILGHSNKVRGYAFYCLSADGRLTEVHGSRGLHWDNSRCRQYPKSILQTAEGTVFGLAENGIAWLHNGKLTQWGWRYGFPTGVDTLHKDRYGNIWFMMKDKIAKLQLGEEPPPVDTACAAWGEHVLAGHGDIWEPRPGHLAMFREDQPGKLSRWDGTRWSYQEVSFDTKHTVPLAVDDREHLLLQAGNKWIDLGPETEKIYPTMEALFENAVREGVKRFSPKHACQSIVVMPQGRIWLSYQGTLRLFDTVRWDQFRFYNTVQRVFPSHKYGVLVLTSGEHLYRYDQGQMVEILPRLAERRELMIGPEGLQPYERAMINAHPKKYFPVVRDQNKMTLFLNVDHFETIANAGPVDGPVDSIEFDGRLTRMWPITSGGYWIGRQGHQLPVRLLGDKAVAIQRKDLPIPGAILAVTEDACGNLWFRVSFDRAIRAFRCPQSKVCELVELSRKCVGIDTSLVTQTNVL